MTMVSPVSVPAITSIAIERGDGSPLFFSISSSQKPRRDNSATMSCSKNIVANGNIRVPRPKVIVEAADAQAGEQGNNRSETR